MKWSKRQFAIVLAALPMVLCPFIADTNTKAQTPPSEATPTETQADEFKDFPTLASGPAPKGVQDAINRFNGKIAYTGFVRRALNKKLGSPAFIAANGISKDAAGKAKLEDLTADQVLQAVAESAHEQTGGIAPKNMRLEAAKHNAFAESVLKKAGVGRVAMATAPRTNALTQQVLSSGIQKFDWRDYGWVATQSGIISQAKINQGSCGCCWAYATIGTFEGAYALANQQLIDASEQNLLDCYATKFGTDVAPFDCQSGGWWAFNQIINPGVADENDYGYVGQQNPTCQDNRGTPFKALQWFYVFTDQTDVPTTMDDIKAIKDALCQYGPIGTAVYASASNSMFGGNDGVTPIKDFPNGQLQTNNLGEQVYIDHLIVIVGWDDTKNAWAIKNSWGQGWGEQGFGYVDYFSNNIGYGSAYVIPAPASPSAAVATAQAVTQKLVPTIPKPQQRKKNQ